MHVHIYVHFHIHITSTHIQSICSVYIFPTNIFHFISMILKHRFSSHYWEPLSCRLPILGVCDRVSQGSWPRLALKLTIPFASVSHLLGIQMCSTKSRNKYFRRYKVKTDVGTRQALSDSNLAEYFFKCVFWSISSIFYLTILKNNSAWKQKGTCQDAHYSIVRKWKPGNSQIVTGREKQATNKTVKRRWRLSTLTYDLQK